MFLYKYLFVVLTIITLCMTTCANKGLITEKYPEDFYKINKLAPDTKFNTNKTQFIIYSDNQAGWRVQHKFLDKKRWTSRKMFIFPFYQLYMLANGLIGGINGLRHVPDFGEKERRLVRDTIYEHAKKINATFILNGGDINAADGRRPEHWKLFLQENMHDHNLLNEFPYFPVIGNHEYANDPEFGFPNFSAIFDFPRFYVIEFPDAAIYIVDSNFILDQNEFIDDTTQDSLFNRWFIRANNTDTLAWLEKKFLEIDKQIKIVVMHHPPITFGKHYSDWFNPNFGSNSINKRNRLLKLFKQHHVRVVFSGHEHSYQHNVLNHNSNDQIHFLVGGGGGTPLRSVSRPAKQENIIHELKKSGFTVAGMVYKSIYHYYLVKIIDSRLEIRVIQVSDKTDHSGQQIDKIIVDKSE